MHKLFIVIFMLLHGKSCCQWSSTYRNGCGVGNPDGIGFRFIAERNNDADFGKFPWTAAIMGRQMENNETKVSYLCGGVVIARNVVLTAAHCINSKIKPFVRGGEWDLSNELEQLAHQDREINKTIFHYKYNFPLYFHDIAIVLLNTSFEFDDHIQPICLPGKEINFQYSNCFVSGWGKKKSDAEVTDKMKEVHYNVISSRVCEATLREKGLGITITENEYCAQNKNDDICQGNSGAPMSCPIPFEQNRYYLAGIATAGVGCGGIDVYTIFLNIGQYRDWIDEKLTAYDIDTKSYTYGH